MVMDLEKLELDMPSGENNEILVAVWMVTYNHADFIEQAVESVMNQKTNFNCKLYIGEDCSTDNTGEICLRLKEKYSDKIELVLNPRNIGASANAQNIFKLCFDSSAKYIAMLEGDDYWTDPLKLQKQYDFLEQNNQYIIHCGKAQVLIENYLKETISNPPPKNTYELSDFFTKNNIFTCTVMFRNVQIPTRHFAHLTFGDWMLYILLLSHKSGNLAFVSDDRYSVYRIHQGGLMQTLTKRHENHLAHLLQIITIKKILNCEYNQGDVFRINEYCITIFAHCLERNNYKNSLKVLANHYYLTKKKVPLRNYLGLLKNHIFKIKNA